jgi:hypothetical protein
VASKKFYSILGIMCFFIGVHGTIHATNKRQSRQEPVGKLIVVAHIPSTGFDHVFKHLNSEAKKVGSWFAPRFRHLHITLASASPTKDNQKKVEKAISAALHTYKQGNISVHFRGNINYHLPQKYAIIHVKNDMGYKKLSTIKELLTTQLHRHKVRGIKAKNPNHVTIGFMGKKCFDRVKNKRWSVAIPNVSIRLYHWKPAKNPAKNSHEDFYLKREFRL